MKKKNYGSRKFIIALITTAAFILFEAAAFVYAFRTKVWEFAIKLAPFLVYSAGIYTAGNVSQDFALKGNKGETTCEN